MLGLKASPFRPTRMATTSRSRAWTAGALYSRPSWCTNAARLKTSPQLAKCARPPFGSNRRCLVTVCLCTAWAPRRRAAMSQDNCPNTPQDQTSPPGEWSQRSSRLMVVRSTRNSARPFASMTILKVAKPSSITAYAMLGCSAPNFSAHADTQLQIAAARQVLRAGGLQR